MKDYEITTKGAREWILGALTATMWKQLRMPEPTLDVSKCMLASMELGVRSVRGAMVKEELPRDREFWELSDWIGVGCMGPPESLPVLCT